MRRMYSKKEIEEMNVQLLASGKVPSIKANEIIEKMSGYSARISQALQAGITLNIDYCGIVKNGNKLTLAIAGDIEVSSDAPGASAIVDFTIPENIGAKLYEMNVGGVNGLSFSTLYCASAYNAGNNVMTRLVKNSNTSLGVELYNLTNLTAETKHLFRYECTFLLSDSLIS